MLGSFDDDGILLCCNVGNMDSDGEILGSTLGRIEDGCWFGKLDSDAAYVGWILGALDVDGTELPCNVGDSEAVGKVLGVKLRTIDKEGGNVGPTLGANDSEGI